MGKDLTSEQEVAKKAYYEARGTGKKLGISEANTNIAAAVAMGTVVAMQQKLSDPGR